jgi:hypothetical protein
MRATCNTAGCASCGLEGRRAPVQDVGQADRSRLVDRAHRSQPVDRAHRSRLVDRAHRSQPVDRVGRRQPGRVDRNNNQTS